MHVTEHAHKIEKSANMHLASTSQAEIDRHRALRMETAKIKKSTTAEAKYREGVEHKGLKQQRLRLVLVQTLTACAKESK